MTSQEIDFFFFFFIRYEVEKVCTELGERQTLAAPLDDCGLSLRVCLMPVLLKSDIQEGDTVPPNLATSLLSGHLDHLQIPLQSPLTHKHTHTHTADTVEMWS